MLSTFTCFVYITVVIFDIILVNDYYKKVYDQATPKVAKYLHADGTVDENPGGGSSDLEDNHQTSIDVSTYTQPVEVTPTSGKDGMKKNTITLNNIPSPGGGAKLYAWGIDGGGFFMPLFYTASPTPAPNAVIYTSTSESGGPAGINTERFVVETFNPSDGGSISVLEDGSEYVYYSYETEITEFIRIESEDIVLV